MKKIIVAFLICFVLAYTACSGDGENNVIRYSKTDIADFKIYIGSSQGGKEYVFPLDQNGSADSAKSVALSGYMSSAYNANLYNDFKAEFNDGMLTYTDSTGYTKIVSTYEFKGDSLFIFKTGGVPRFVAVGSMDSLYRTRYISRYWDSQREKDTVRVHTDVQTLDKVLQYAGYSGLQDMKDISDTVMWCNVKYVFNK
ncbi:hypothetical protein D0T84_04250 [Dysgonomonas sp. 521]|uniref:hypothetical protein n=1 Tax=Dysgonomonas sp. 521 TaxID=2302932 RepID=UPI0013D03FC6|nr:hypothetical protein [Dysgonomonas sp. 521]NDV94130.1 hypothetical protein [Dysgonomonas sp. 521]